VKDWTALSRFCTPIHTTWDAKRPWSCPHVHGDVVAADIAAAKRYHGVAAHLAACGPCSGTSPGSSPRWSFGLLIAGQLYGIDEG
jgi:hypothetical protein